MPDVNAPVRPAAVPGPDDPMGRAAALRALAAERTAAFALHGFHPQAFSLLALNLVQRRHEPHWESSYCVSAACAGFVLRQAEETALALRALNNALVARESGEGAAPAMMWALRSLEEEATDLSSDAVAQYMTFYTKFCEDVGDASGIDCLAQVRVTDSRLVSSKLDHARLTAACS